MLAVPLERLDEGGLEVVVAHQVPLGQWRTLVGRVCLLSVEHDVSVEAALSEFPYGPPAANPAPTTTKVCLGVTSAPLSAAANQGEKLRA